jgi:hypothetical protein
MMREFEGLFDLKTEFEGIVYRNIFTIYHSQDLFDDLNLDSEFANDILQRAENITSGVSHESSQKNRLFDYGQAHGSCISDTFKPPYTCGRFGDGNSYGVWYSATDEKTSIYEAFFHQWRRTQYQFKINPKTHLITIDRKMFACEVKSKDVLDFRTQLELHNKLTSNDYKFCIELGKKVKERNIQMLLVPSARNIGGVCSPVFLPEIIKSEKAIYYLKFYFHKDGKAEIERISNKKETFDFPTSWKEQFSETHVKSL